MTSTHRITARSLRLPLRGASRAAVWRRGVARKIAAALLVGIAAYLTIGALRPPPPDPGPLVVVAAADLPVGAELAADSVRTAHLPADLVPRGALTQPHQAVGSVLAAPLRAGEVLTDLRLSPGAALAGLDPDLVLAHLPLTDPQLSHKPVPRLIPASTPAETAAVLAAEVLIVPAAPGVGVGLGFLGGVTTDQGGQLAAATGGELPGRGVTVLIRP